MTGLTSRGPRSSTPASRVLLYSDAPYEGGAERYIEYLVDALPADWSPALLVRDAAALDAWAGRLRARGLHVERTPGDGARALVMLQRAVREMRPDVVHINLPHGYRGAYGLAAPVARVSGARAVVTTEHLTMITPMRARGRLRRVATRAVDRIITLSESNRRDLVERHGLPTAKIRVVRNGVPRARDVAREEREAVRRAICGEEGPGPVLLLVVGALTERKGHRFLFDALSRLQAEGCRDWRLLVLGDGEDASSLRERVETLGLGHAVHFGGHQPDVAPALAAADAVVLPSRVEGMPLTLLEALAAGRPAVATRIFGVPEIFGDAGAGLLVEYGDVAALAEALRRIVSDEPLRRAMGSAARARYQASFRAERMAAETAAVYAEALA